jgi:acyl phosphate:glycerol-3-phosphate acyltransferase
VHPAVAVLVAYLCGSIPAAYLAGRAHGVDLRKHGSGNLGATNVVRVLGAKVGALVFAVDVVKGALPVALLPRWTPVSRPDLWAIAFGLAAILGHVRPIFLLGRGGGKGVATASGVFLALAPIPMLAALLTFATVFYATGYVSVGSLSGAVVLPAALLVMRGPAAPVFLISVAVAAFVFWTHRTNLGRLRRGEEHRFGRHGEAAGQGPAAGDPASAASPAPAAPPAPVDRRIRRRLDDHERRQQPRGDN